MIVINHVKFQVASRSSMQGRHTNTTTYKLILTKLYMVIFLFSLMWCAGQFTCISTNLTGPEVNDHINLQ